MNKKQFLLIVGVGLAIVLAAIVVNHRRSAIYQVSAAAGGKVLPGFDPNVVMAVGIHQGTDQVDLAKSNQTWGVVQRGGYPADFSKISGMLRKFWDLKVARPIHVGPSRLPALALESADKGSTVIEFRGADLAPLATVTLGTNVVTQADAWSNDRYVMVDKSPDRISLVSESFSDIAASPTAWLNKGFVKVENLVGVSVVFTNAVDNWALKRDDPSGEWSLVDAKAGETLDAAKAGGVSRVLSSAQITDVATGVTDADTGMAEPTVATLKTQDGFTYVLSMGRKGEDGQYVKVDVGGTFPTTREVAPDEKPEDKEKLDQEFQAKISGLKSKLEQEKRREGWTYVIPSWAVDSLNKPRSELLKVPEQKEKEDSTKGVDSGL